MSDPQWADTTVLSGDIAAAVAELKAKPGRELQVHGSQFRWLLDNGLVDEMTLFIFPVLVGQGARLFPDTRPGQGARPGRIAGHPSGMAIQVHRPAGRPRYG